ncbi:hypothetical protein PG984_006623 [Apiospora sp. TS-2023a]
MTATPDDDFKPTHRFPHPYGDAEVLRKYLTDTAQLEESQFRIRDTIVEQFREAERKKKEESNKGLPKAD